MVSRNCQTLVMTGLVFSTLSLPLSARAANISFEQIFVFGNSRSDTGNVFSLNNNLFPPPSLYNDGRFSNEFVWIDYVNQNLGLNPSTFYGGSFTNADDGINFASGGATTGTTSLAGLGFPGIMTQVNDFISFLNGAEVDEDALITLWGGENDYAESLLTQGLILDPTVAINNISNSLKKLIDSGAKNILVSNLPNLGDIPLGRDLAESETLNSVTAIHNSLLKSEVESLQTSFPETNLVLFDANSVLKEIFDNPTEFGLNANPLESCLSPNNFPNIDPNVVRCDNPDDFLYYDNQHFTSKVHGFIGDAAWETIQEEFSVPIPESRNTISLIALGMGFLFQFRKRIS